MQETTSQTLQKKARIALRNLRGHAELVLFLCRWDKAARRQTAITFIIGAAALELLLGWHTAGGLTALALLAVALALLLGWPPSLLPQDYRPERDRLLYSAETCTHVRRNDHLYAMADIFPAQTEAAHSFYNPIAGWDICPESPLVSNAVDDFLMQRKTLPYKVAENNSRYILSRHQLLYLAIRVGNKVQNTQNLEKLELYDTAAALMDENRPLTVRKSLYFNALMTAEAFRSRLFRNNLQGRKEVYTDMTGYFPAEEEKLHGKDILRFTPDFYKSVAGRIGVTTLLLTENRRVAMLLQGESKPVGGGQVNLGGSGSINYDDIELSGNTGDLRDVVTYAMTRELCEETGLKEWFGSAHIHTLITGFFRWADRCGHPEFIGITFARNAPFSRQNKIDGDEVVKYEEIPVTVDTPKDFAKVMDYIRANKINVALSSLMALHRLMVIASYDAESASSAQKKILRDLTYFIEARIAS